MKLAFWQGRLPESVGAALDEMEATVSDADADVVVFPELFLGGYLLEDAGARVSTPADLARAQDIAARNATCVVFGYFERSGSLYNSALAINAEGAVVAKYRKTHLFGAAERAAFSPGDRLGDIFDIKGVKAALLICYDLEFCEAPRALALRGAKILIVPTANMKPYDVVNDVVVPVRALENHAFVCYCNWAEFVSAEGVHFNGRSSICGPDGHVLEKFDDISCGVKTTDVHIQDIDETEDDYLQDRRPELYADLLR
ncbi:hypothetical protein CTAYLR_003060 [Chrysophaeum taylorii]|uniref:CN hydrolase domain-containing protein n=1 Tax=Chrysophaeum taylorii TaxID=2483200 RepID=A0AAD7U7S0_9STRA|nr:hypothetical protein CTAYLR_003060 [Chrysophaeum taylorii]